MDSFLKAAGDAGWAVREPLNTGPGALITLGRGDERIQIEMSNGGLPHRVWRTTADGHTTTLGQNYFTMSQVLGWLGDKHA